MSLQSSYAEWDAHIPASVTEQADRLTEDPEGAEVFTPMAPEPKLTLPQDTKMPGRHRKPTKAKAKLRPAVFFKIFAASLVGSEPEVTFAKHNQ